MGSVRPGWMDPEQTNYLSGLFQQIVEDCKVCHSLFTTAYFREDFLSLMNLSPTV
jgi:hypothetical protein